MTDTSVPVEEPVKEESTNNTKVEPEKKKEEAKEEKKKKPPKKRRSRSANLIASLFRSGDEIPEIPPQPPQIRAFSLGSKGELSMSFSAPV